MADPGNFLDLLCFLHCLLRELVSRAGRRRRSGLRLCYGILRDGYFELIRPPLRLPSSSHAPGQACVSCRRQRDFYLRLIRLRLFLSPSGLALDPDEHPLVVDIGNLGSCDLRQPQPATISDRQSGPVPRRALAHASNFMRFGETGWFHQNAYRFERTSERRRGASGAGEAAGGEDQHAPILGRRGAIQAHQRQFITRE